MIKNLPRSDDILLSIEGVKQIHTSVVDLPGGQVGTVVYYDMLNLQAGRTI